MIACLQMYDWPETAAAHDGFWRSVAAALSARGIAAPAELTRGPDLAAPWRSPGLLLGQTCGYPLTLGLAGDAEVVGRPVHAAEGCGRGSYRSAFVARREDAGTPLASFRGRRAAVNEWNSQSGFNVFADALARLDRPVGPFFGAAHVSGGHRASALAVAAGEADLASIDCVSWALFAEHEPAAAAALTVIGWSAEAPSLPYITAAGNAGIREALRAALAEAAGGAPPDPALPVDVVGASRADYAPIAAMAARAAAVDFAPGAPRAAVPAG